MSQPGAKPPRLPALAQNFGLLASPPPLQVVVARAFVSCALAMRAQLDQHDDVTAAAQLLESARDWLTEHRFTNVLNDDETICLATPLGALTPTTIERYGLLGEAAAVLGWALRCGELAAPDVATDAADAAVTLGFLTPEGQALATRARLRDRDETARYADIAGALHWRLQRQISEPGHILMSRWRSDAFAWPEGVTPAQFADEDLAADGRSITTLSDTELLPLLQRTAERHRAALWLLGQQRDYWQVAAQIS